MAFDDWALAAYTAPKMLTAEDRASERRGRSNRSVFI
jgi:hypothetical protein